LDNDSPTKLLGEIESGTQRNLLGNQKMDLPTDGDEVGHLDKDIEMAEGGNKNKIIVDTE